MHTSSNDVLSQNQLAMRGVAHKLYIHAHPSILSMWDKSTFTTPTGFKPQGLGLTVSGLERR